MKVENLSLSGPMGNFSVGNNLTSMHVDGNVHVGDGSQIETTASYGLSGSAQFGHGNILYANDSAVIGQQSSAGTKYFKIVKDARNSSFSRSNPVLYLDSIDGLQEDFTVSLTAYDNYNSAAKIISAYTSGNDKMVRLSCDDYFWRIFEERQQWTRPQLSSGNGIFYVPGRPQLGTTPSEDPCFAEGYDVHAVMLGSHAEGCQNLAEGKYSHAEGRNSYAYGYCSHTEGQHQYNMGRWSHTGGFCSKTDHDRTYVWTGMFSSVNYDTYGHDNGEGTFNIYPKGGISGVWIGDGRFNGTTHVASVSSLAQILDNQKSSVAGDIAALNGRVNGLSGSVASIAEKIDSVVDGMTDVMRGLDRFSNTTTILIEQISAVATEGHMTLTDDEIDDIWNGTVFVQNGNHIRFREYGVDEPYYGYVAGTEEFALSAGNNMGLRNGLTYAKLGKQFKSLTYYYPSFPNSNGFYTCRTLRKAVIPHVISVGNYAFGGCWALSSIDMPNVRYIGSGVFNDNHNLLSVRFGNNIGSLGSQLFQNCHQLKLVDMRANTVVPSVQSSTFNYAGISTDVQLSVLVPHALYANWTANTGWRNISAYMNGKLEIVDS